MSTTPNEPTPTPPIGNQPPAPPAPAPSPPAAPPANSDPVQLPEDHPLVKAYNAQKDQIKNLKAGQVDPDELKRLREIDAASKTQAEKDAEELARLRKENEGYKSREQIAAWAKEVSEETEVPADLLRGSTKEELKAHAEQLKPLIGAQQPGQQQTPGVVPTIGQTPQTPPNIPLSEQIAAAEREVATATRGTPEHKLAQQKVMALKGLQLREAAGK